MSIFITDMHTVTLMKFTDFANFYKDLDSKLNFKTNIVYTDYQLVPPFMSSFAVGGKEEFANVENFYQEMQNICCQYNSIPNIEIIIFSNFIKDYEKIKNCKCKITLYNI